MTRFDAGEPKERRKLFADAVVAHRRRGSDALAVEGEREDGPARLRLSGQTVEVDCADEERARLDDLLGEFPEFRADGETETDAGTRVRISARADANRLSEFVERTFRSVYGLADDYRAWVVAV